MLVLLRMFVIGILEGFEKDMRDVQVGRERERERVEGGN